MRSLRRAKNRPFLDKRRSHPWDGDGIIHTLRLKTGAESPRAERYHKCTEFFANRLDDSRGFRYVVKP